MDNHQIRNNILIYIYDHERIYAKLYREQTQDPGFSHVFLNQLEKGLGLNSRQVETNIKWLEKQGEVEFIQFEEGMWGCSLTDVGKARISEPYTGNAEEDRKLGRSLSMSSLVKNWIGILVLIVPFFLQCLSVLVFDFDLWNWVKSLFC